MPELRHIYAMSHLPFTYETNGDLLKPFVLGVDDASGDGIADRRAWSETRGHYWLWKNVQFADDELVSVGQYRRCFWLPQLIQPDSQFHRYAEPLNKNLGQQILHMMRPEYIEYVSEVDRADRARLNEWLSGVDLIVSRAIEYPKTIAAIYGEHHRATDWEIFAGVCHKYGLDEGKHPWLTGHLMFMMRRDLFHEYMELWWRVMLEVDERLAHEDHWYQHRKIGYLTERFMSAWLIKIRTERPELCIQTLPIVEGLFQFSRTDPNVM